MPRRLRVALAVVCLALAVFLLFVNTRGLRTPAAGSHLAQLRFLNAAVDRGAASDMQRYFPEGFVFTQALQGLACTSLAHELPPDSRHALVEQAMEALAALESDEARRPFSSQTYPPDGVFLLGWRSRLRAHLIELLPSGPARDSFIETLRAECDLVAAALERSASPFLCSYPDHSWPVDTVVAVASLRASDRILADSRYAPVVTKWIESAKVHSDPVSGLLPHRSHPISGLALDDPRGSSQSLINVFLPEIDADWATTHYRAFRGRFVDSVLGISGVREHPSGVQGGWDVDSGPLIFGLSASASAVSIGAASANGDEPLAHALSRSAELCGLPVTWAGRKRYALGLLPVGDAFLVWSRTTPRQAVAATTWPPPPSPRAFRVVTLGAATILVATSLHLIRRRNGSPRPTI